VRAMLDYLEDKVSLLAKSMFRTFEQINKRRDGLITKDELLWLLNKFQLQIPLAGYDRLWCVFDTENAGHVPFATLLQQLDKSHEGRSGGHVQEAAHLRSTHLKLPSVAAPGLRPMWDQAKSGRTGKVGAQTYVDNYGDAHLSTAADRAPRYVNQYPFHSGQTHSKAALPQKVPHDAFNIDLCTNNPVKEEEFKQAMTRHWQHNAVDPNQGCPPPVHPASECVSRRSCTLPPPCFGAKK